MRSRSAVCLCAILAITALVPAGPTPGGARAQSATPADPAAAKHLDDLFSRLKAAGSDLAAEPIVAEIWEAWRDAAPAGVKPLAQQAGLEMTRGDIHAAVAVLDEVVRRAPAWAEGWNQRATMLYLLGDHARSLADCDRVLALEPRHFGALAGMGLIHIAAGRLADGLAAYKRALVHNPYLKERDSIIPALEQRLQGKPL